MYCEPHLRDQRVCDRWIEKRLVHFGRPHHLVKLRKYVAKRNAALEAERRREARHFGCGR